MADSYVLEIVKAATGTCLGALAALGSYLWTGYKLSPKQNLYLAPIAISYNEVCIVNKKKLQESWVNYKNPSPTESEAYSYFSSLPESKLVGQFTKSFPNPLRDHLRKSGVFDICKSQPEKGHSISNDTTLEIAMAMKEDTKYLVSKNCDLILGDGDIIPVQIEDKGTLVSNNLRPISNFNMSENLVLISGPVSLPASISIGSNESPKRTSDIGTTPEFKIKCSVLTPEGFMTFEGNNRISNPVKS
jgi:hypothetical protein